MKVYQIPFSADPIDTIADHILRNYEISHIKSIIFVSPNIRSGLYLVKRLGSKIGREFIPPLRFSMDEFIRYLAKRAGLNVGEPSLFNHVFLVYSILKEMNFEVFEKEEVEREYSLIKWAYEIFRSIREMNREGVKREIVEALSVSARRYGIESINSRIENIWKIMDRIRSEFNRRVEEIGGTGLEYMELVENIKKEGVIPENPLYIWGIYALTNTEKEILKKIAEEKEDLTVFLQFDREMMNMEERYPHIKSIIELFGIPEEIKVEEREPEIKIHRAFTVHSEVKRLQEILKDVISRREKGEDICIVLPDESNLFPVIEMAISPYIKDRKFNITMGFPLKRTPFYSLFKKHLKLLEEFLKEDITSDTFLSFIKHPYIKRINIDNFHIRERLKDVVEAGMDLRMTPDSMKRILGNENYEIFYNNFIEPFLSIENPDDFVKKMEHFLIEILYRKGDVIRRSSFSQEFLYHIIGTLLKEMEDIKIPLHVLNIYRTFIFSMERARVPFRGEPLKGIQVMGLLETRGIRFEDVIVMDVNEGILPSVYGSDPILPPPIRRELGLPLPWDTEAVYRYHFYRLIMGARNVNIIYREGIKAENRMSASRFVEELKWRKDIEDIETVNLSFRPGEIIKDREVEKGEHIIKKLHELNRLSHHAIATYIECPLKFYFKYILGIEEKEEEEEEKITGLKAGNILHQTLGKLYADIEDHYRLKKDFNNILKKGFQLLDESIEENLKGVAMDRGRIGITRLIMRKKLEDFLNFDKERVFYGVQVERSIEREIEMGGPKTLRRRLKLYGKADRIERDESGNIVIIDYKTGKKNNPKKCKLDNIHKNFSSKRYCFQLQLYLYIAGAEEGARGMLFYLLEPENPVEEWNYNPGIEEILKMELEEIFNPDTKFYIRESPPCASSYKISCPYKEICEVRKVLSE